MADLNSVTLSGNLTRDPELRSTSGGKNVCSLRIGSKGYGDKSGFYDVTVWDTQSFDLAVVVANAFSKGDKFVCTGRLDYREWATDDGSKRFAVQVVASDVILPPRGDAPAPAPEPEF